MSAAHKLPITAAEYLEGERQSDIRHEFMDGRVFAMSGASRRENEICGDLAATLQSHLRGGPCRTYIEAVKVQVADDLGEAYYYPESPQPHRRLKHQPPNQPFPHSPHHVSRTS